MSGRTSSGRRKKGGSELAAAEKAWRATIVGDTSPSTTSDIPLPTTAIPTAEQLTEGSYLDRLGFPGQFPYTRGIHSTMYRGRYWTMRQYAGFGSAAETNRRYHYLLEQGTTGLSVAFDLPTQMGRDSDHALARGEVGRVGVAIDSLEDMAQLFEGIPLGTVSTSMTINATAHILLAFYLAVARQQNVAWSALRGTVQNDVLKEYIARGTYIYPPQPALKITTDIFEFCRDQVPQWNTISISGYHIREAGSTAVQEVAFTLADGINYVESALARGLDIDSFAPRLAFFFNCHNNFLEEIAKFRAARRMWAKIMKERFAAKDERSLVLRFHTQTAGSSLTAQQPRVNIVRTTLQALAAVLGGTQSLHTNGFDEALSLPTEESALLALRTQQVIAQESGVTESVDPLGGSYLIESLTDEIERRAFELIAQVDSLGGMVRAIEAGMPQTLIEEAAFRYQRQIESGERSIVGVNKFVAKEAGEPARLLKIDPKLEREQQERLGALKQRRDNSGVRTALAELSRVAREGSNIMPAVYEAVVHHATLGEISDELRAIFGEYRQG